MYFLVLLLVAAGCGKDPFLDDPADRLGALEISSVPTGVSILLNGQPRGETRSESPIVVNGLPYGWHAIRATFPGKVTRLEEVELREKRLRVQVPLEEPAFGRTVIYTTPPGAEVFIESRYYGVTKPFLVINDLSFGSHTLWVRLKGHQDKRRTIVVERQLERAYRLGLAKK
ncbi:MAG: PEGA domain-containing protein [bacterium]|nr:PEGA domain-containing protein [bacterium]